MAWFVMLRSQTGEFPIPFVDLEDDIALFSSEEEARKSAERNMIGRAFGFEVYKW